METLGYLLVATTAIWLWTDKAMLRILMKKDKNGIKYIYRNKKMEKLLDRKPFNCGTCLAIYTSIVLFYCFQDLYLLTLPIVHRLIYKYMH